MVHQKKQMKVKSDDKTRGVKIDSTKKVKMYIEGAWKMLAGISLSEVATRLSRGNGVPSVDDAVINKYIGVLIERIDKFIPIVFLSGNDVVPYRKRNREWQGRLMKVADLVSRDSKPTYLVDAVNVILKNEADAQVSALKESVESIIQLKENKQKLNDEQKAALVDNQERIKDVKKQLVCTPMILAKYLHMNWTENLKFEDVVPLMKPDVIAKFIIERSGTPWELLPVKMDSVTYTVNIDKASKWKKADVKEHLEIPYFCPSVISSMAGHDILADIESDIKLIDDFINWSTSHYQTTLSDEYLRTYNSYIDKFKTFKLSVDTLKKSKTNKKQVITAAAAPVEPHATVAAPVTTQSVEPDEILMYVASYTRYGSEGSIPDWITEKCGEAAQLIAKHPDGARLFTDLKRKYSSMADDDEGWGEKAKSTVVANAIIALSDELR